MLLEYSFSFDENLSCLFCVSIVRLLKVLCHESVEFVVGALSLHFLVGIEHPELRFSFVYDI